MFLGVIYKKKSKSVLIISNLPTPNKKSDLKLAVSPFKESENYYCYFRISLSLKCCSGAVWSYYSTIRHNCIMLKLQQKYLFSPHSIRWVLRSFLVKSWIFLTFFPEILNSEHGNANSNDIPLYEVNQALIARYLAGPANRNSIPKYIDGSNLKLLTRSTLVTTLLCKVPNQIHSSYHSIV